MGLIALTQAEIKEIVEDLQGTCKSLDQAICDVVDQRVGNDRIYGLEGVVNWTQLCSYLDDRLFLCAKCGWWCEAGDYAEHQPDPDNGDICSDCGEDYEGEED